MARRAEGSHRTESLPSGASHQSWTLGLDKFGNERVCALGGQPPLSPSRWQRHSRVRPVWLVGVLVTAALLVAAVAGVVVAVT